MAANPASAEVCSRIGTDIFAVPRNDPYAETAQERDALETKGRLQTDEMIRQIMRRGDPLFMRRGDGAATGWPCLGSHPVRIKDEVIRQRIMHEELQKRIATEVAADAGDGVSKAMKAVAKDAVSQSSKGEVEVDYLDPTTGFSVKGTESHDSVAIKTKGT